MPNVILIPGGSSTASPFSWRIVPIGAGGFNTGLSVGFDGVNQTVMVRTDTFGAYRWDPGGVSPINTTGCWTQLVNATSMPANFLSGAPFVAGRGVYEIQMCYSSPSVVYMSYTDVEATNLNNSTVWKSTDRGNTWTRTAFTPVNRASNMEPNGGTKTSGPKICINPSNSNQLFVGTIGAGLFKSTDGNTFSTVTTGAGGAPAPTGGSDYNGMCWSVSNTSNVYIVSNGNGVYASTNGGSSFAVAGTGGPTSAAWAAIDEHNGHYWVLDNGGALWVWNGSTWSNPVLSQVNSFAIDPTTADHLTYNFNNNRLVETFNGFGASVASDIPNFGGDLPWLTSAGVSANAFSCTFAAYFDRIAAKTLWQSSNLGTWLTTPWSGNISTSTHPVFNIQGRGMEQQVGLEAVVPPGGNPLFTVWDNGIFPQPDNNISAAYPTAMRPQAYATGTPTAAWSLDYSGGTPTFCVMIGTGQYEGGVDHLATTSDGGNAWTSIQVHNPTNDSNGACVAVSDSNHFIVGDCNTRQPFYTLDGGTTWTAITLPGTPAWTNFGGLEGRGKWIIADKVNSGNFAMSFVGLGIFTNTNNGQNGSWTGPFNASVVNNADDFFKAVPGQAGHAIIYWGQNAINQLVQNPQFFITTNLYAGASQTWTGISNMKAVYAAGFGAPAAGTSYPALFVAGYTSLPCTGSFSNAVATNVAFPVTGAPAHTILPGSPVVMSDNGGGDMRGTVVSYVGGTLIVNIDSVLDGAAGPFSAWIAQIYGIFTTTGNSAPGATPIWTQLTIWPNNNIDEIQNISGDPNVVGRCYVSTGGASFLYYG